MLYSIIQVQTLQCNSLNSTNNGSVYGPGKSVREMLVDSQRISLSTAVKMGRNFMLDNIALYYNTLTQSNIIEHLLAITSQLTFTALSCIDAGYVRTGLTTMID